MAQGKLAGVTALITVEQFQRDIGSLALGWRLAAFNTSNYFQQYTRDADGGGNGVLKNALLGLGMDPLLLAADEAVLYAMKNLQIVYSGGTFPQTNFAAAIEPACGS